MLRDSCLYSSLACSVYSISFFFFFSFWNHMQIFIHQLTQTRTLWSVPLNIYLCTFFFFEFTRGEIEWIFGRHLLDSEEAFAIVCKTQSGRWSRSRRSSITAAASSGLWFQTFCSFYCCLPRWSQVLHGNTDLYCISLIQTLLFWLKHLIMRPPNNPNWFNSSLFMLIPPSLGRHLNAAGDASLSYLPASYFSVWQIVWGNRISKHRAHKTFPLSRAEGDCTLTTKFTPNDQRQIQR